MVGCLITFLRELFKRRKKIENRVRSHSAGPTYGTQTGGGRERLAGGNIFCLRDQSVVEDTNLMLGCAYTQVWIRGRFPGSGYFLQLGIVLFFSVIECPDETLWGDNW